MKYSIIWKSFSYTHMHSCIAGDYTLMFHIFTITKNANYVFVFMVFSSIVFLKPSDEHSELEQASLILIKTLL